jgi:hypothetical protein
MTAIAEANGQKIADGADLAANQPDVMAGTPKEQAPPTKTPPPSAERAQMEKMAMPVKPSEQGPHPVNDTNQGKETRTRIDNLNAFRNAKDELWNKRLTAIAAAHGQNLDGSAVAVPDGPETAARNEMAPQANAMPAAMKSGAEGEAMPRVPQPAVPVQRSVLTAKLNTYTPAERADIRQALVKGLNSTQIAPADNAGGQKTMETGALNEPQRQALTAFVTVADGISRALAADDLKAFNLQAAQLATVLPSLQQELVAPNPFAVLVKRLAAAVPEQPAPDLRAARSRFLAFSTTAVEIVKALRKADPKFFGLKIYHCPMAPEPGLWMQAHSPLANPFYGRDMLTCGEEVTE